MRDHGDWRRLTGPDYVGGAVRDRDDEGRPVHRRIARVEMDGAAISFHFDRVAALIGGRWRDMPLADNDFIWFPYPMMPVAFDADGTARPGTAALPAFVDAIHPRTALPADSPAFPNAQSN